MQSDCKVPNRLGQSCGFSRFPITIPMWFLVVILIVAVAVAWYLIHEVRGLRRALYSWRDVCKDMDSDDGEVRRRAMRTLQRLREMVPTQLCGDWRDRRPRNQEGEVPLRCAGEHWSAQRQGEYPLLRSFRRVGPCGGETVDATYCTS